MANDNRKFLEIFNDGTNDLYIRDQDAQTHIGNTNIHVTAEVKAAWNGKISALVSKTYSQLKAMRDGSTLVAGQWYRITDYVTTTSLSGTQSAGCPFDILVRADDTDKLNENAYAVKHSGNTYFANSNLSAWKLKYCIDNNTNRFTWADTTNGKGVIYYMKDEFGNECHYDFKNIQFRVGAKAKAGTVAGVYYFTFSVVTGTNDSRVTDHSLHGDYCYCNKIGVAYTNKKTLNLNVFRNTGDDSECHGNILGLKCTNNTFGDGCTCNMFVGYCSINDFGAECYCNYFTYGCNRNVLGNSCFNNTFGDSCSNNTLMDNCNNNIFGNSCLYNIFGSNCRGNILGNNCDNNTLGDYCNNNTFGNYCYYNKFGNSSSIKSYVKFVTIESGNEYLNIDCSATTSFSACMQNITIAKGVNNTPTYKTITHPTAGDTFKTEYRPTNSQIVLV